MVAKQFGTDGFDIVFCDVPCVAMKVLNVFLMEIIEQSL
jgi:hypothetical protein